MQILIIMDFLLSLSTKAKEKLAKALPENLNRSVTYADQTLSEEDVSGSILLNIIICWELTNSRLNGPWIRKSQLQNI